MSEHRAGWWGIEHTCDDKRREYPVLHWADEPENGAGPRRAFECDACGDRYAFHEAEAGDGSGVNVEWLAQAMDEAGPSTGLVYYGTDDPVAWDAEAAKIAAAYHVISRRKSA